MINIYGTAGILLESADKLRYNNLVCTRQTKVMIKKDDIQ